MNSKKKKLQRKLQKQSQKKSQKKSVNIDIDVPKSTQDIMLKMIKKQNRLLIWQIARKYNWDYQELIDLINRKGANKIII